MFAAGVFCAIVSHPADTIVSKLNQQKGSSFITIGKNLGFLGKLFRGIFRFHRAHSGGQIIGLMPAKERNCDFKLFSLIIWAPLLSYDFYVKLLF